MDVENIELKNIFSLEILFSNKLMVISDDYVVFVDEEGNIIG